MHVLSRKMAFFSLCSSNVIGGKASLLLLGLLFDQSAGQKHNSKIFALARRKASTLLIRVELLF